MKTHVRLKFKSRLVHQEVLAKCRMHGISFEKIEAAINEHYFLVEPGSVDLSEIEIGKRRIVENPSRRLDEMIDYRIEIRLARATGKPLPPMGFGSAASILEGIVF